MKKTRSLVSIIIPLHNEAGNIEWHHKKIKKVLDSTSVSYEVIYIDDGSTDESLDIIKGIARKDPSTRYTSFSRNFGKESAITAGLKRAEGNAALILDADGQHPIEMIDEFLTKWYEGYDIVVGTRESNQGEGMIKSFGSKLFYFSLRILGGSHEAIPASTDFRLIDRKVIDQYNLLTERNRISRNLMDWLGFKRAIVPFNAHARHTGKASYSYSKLVKLALDAAIKHSTRPLKLIGLLGILISFIAFLLMLFLFTEQYLLHDPMHLAISGTAILATFLGFLVGIVLTCQGLLALYLETVYYETQNRPLYIIRDESK